MQIETVGDGEPEVAVVGGIHGDEPCGVRAVETLRSEQLDVERPVAFVIANERAIAAETRYVDVDLNRSFPGDPAGDAHEERLAARLTEELKGCAVLSLHSTQSYPAPFAIVNGLGEFQRRVCRQLPVDSVVDGGRFEAGRIFQSVQDSIEVECGLQGSPTAAENATAIVRAFLKATAVLPGGGVDPTTSLPVFELERPVRKAVADQYEVYAENFQPVREGDAFAAVDGEQLHAEEGFYPVLMSAEGYDDLFGYAARKVGELS